MTVAQESTLQRVLERVDPDLTATPGSDTAAMGGPAIPIVSKALAATERLRGLVLTSDRAVRWSLLVDAVEVAAFRTETGAPAFPVTLPGSLGAGSTVSVEAVNESDQGDAACDAALLTYTRSS